MTVVASNTELMAALSTAAGGETFELAPGDFGTVTLKNKLFPSDVTLVSADPANPAVIHNLTIQRSSHLVFDGILFDFVAVIGDPETVAPFVVDNSAFVTIRNSIFDGGEVPSTTGDPGSYGTGYGLWVIYSDNIIVENNEFFKFRKALAFFASSNVTVAANDVHMIRSDGMNFIAVDGLLLDGNWIHDFKVDPTGSDHPDMIQFLTAAGWVASKNMIIRGNFLDAGTGSVAQALFMSNSLVDKAGGSFETDAYQNILIEDNVIYNDMAHGITVGSTDGLVIRNNTLLFDPFTVPALDMPPRINMSEPSLNVVIENNITGDVFNWDDTVNHIGWIVTNNLLVQYDDPTGENYPGDLFVNALVANATLADLRAVAGGLVETMGVGAAMTRADIPLLVGPYATAPDPVPEPGVCEVLLAEALDVVADLETQLAAMTASLASVTGLMDVALAERDTAEAALADMTTLWGETVDTLVVTETALADMTIERDTAVAKLDAILVILEAN